MKTNIIPIIALILLVLLMCGVAGCAATPEDRWFQKREALNTANQVYLANLPLMNDEQIVYHGELLQAARASLEQAKTHLPGGGAAFDAALDIVEAILIQLANPDRVSATVNTHPAIPDMEDVSDDTR